MALAPALLRRRLIGSVVGVGGELLALPAAPTRALTLGLIFPLLKLDMNTIIFC
jgi:hypothetical protein